MKNLYFTILFLFSFFTLSFSQTTWDNFEDTRKGTYGFINGLFVPYNLNPDQTGANTSQVAASYTRNAGEAFDVIILDAQMADLSDYLSGSKQMSIDVWSPAAGITIQITLENSVLALPANFPTGRHSVYLTTTTVANAWETLTFSFDNQPDPSVANDNVDRIVLLFNPNTNTGDTYYWDNLEGPEFAMDPCDDPGPSFGNLNDFECNQNVNFTFSHGGSSFRRVINPDQTAPNQTEYCATYTRNAGEENDVIVGYFNEPITLVSGSEFNLDVWDPTAPTEVKLSLQFEDANGTTTDFERMTATTGNSSTWETLDFFPDTAVGQTINKFVILFDPGNFTSDNYFFDNFNLSNTPVSISELDPKIIGLKNYPNPTNGISTFEYQLIENGKVQLTILDQLGKEVEVLVNERQLSGDHLINWDNNQYPSGVYFYRMRVDGVVSTGKIIKM